MSFFHVISLAAASALMVAPAISVGQTAAAASAAEANPKDCGKTTIKRHDHGAERGGGSTGKTVQVNKPCPPDAGASAATAKSKKLPSHDHGATKNN